MCGRFTLRTPASLLQELFGLREPPSVVPRYNIAPTQPIGTVHRVEDDRVWEPMRWGLVPHWADDPSIGNRMINARAESLERKPAFREPFAARRCLIPADGFYEWERLPDGSKQPWYLSLRDDEPFAFAGLWDRWRDQKGGAWLRSCALVTTEPNALLAPIHDRMPAMLRSGAMNAWLQPDARPGELKPLLAPPPPGVMKAVRVSARVNRPEFDDPDCIAPTEDLHRLRTLF